MRNPMTRQALVRSVLGFALAVLASTTICTPAEQVERMPILSGSDGNLRFVPLGVGKSMVIDLPRDAKDVLVANPEIANAVVRSTRRAYLIGVKVGQTNVFFFDAEGRQIA